MSRFINNQITKAGLRLVAKSQTGIPITYTKILLGDGFLSPEQDIKNITNVVHEIATINITKCVIEDDRAAVGGSFPSTLRTGFYYRELALFAYDSDLEKEILYSYSNAGDQAEWIPPASDESINERFVEILTTVSNTTNISAYIDSGMYATIDLVNYYANQSKPVSWQASDILGENTSIAYDISANGGQPALLDSAGKYVDGITAQRELLFGEYIAIFRLKTNSIEGAEYIIACEIMPSTGDIPLASRVIAPSEFEQIDKWTYFKIPFENESTSNLDKSVYPRVRYLSGSAEVKVDNIIITSNNLAIM